MSKLSLDKQEVQFLVHEGWTTEKSPDGIEFWMDLGARQVTMFPVIKRLLTPISLRAQAMFFDDEYSKVAQGVGWVAKGLECRVWPQGAFEVRD